MYNVHVAYMTHTNLYTYVRQKLQILHFKTILTIICCTFFYWLYSPVLCLFFLMQMIIIIITFLLLPFATLQRTRPERLQYNNPGHWILLLFRTLQCTFSTPFGSIPARRPFTGVHMLMHKQNRTWTKTILFGMEKHRCVHFYWSTELTKVDFSTSLIFFFENLLI